MGLLGEDFKESTGFCKLFCREGFGFYGFRRPLARTRLSLLPRQKLPRGAKGTS